MPEEKQEAQQERQEKESGNNNENKPRIIRRLSNMVCKDGLVLLDGTLILTDEEISLINASQIRGRVDLNSPAPNQDVSDNETKKAIVIPIESVESMTYETVYGRPSLLLKWNDNTRAFGKTRKTQFIQRGGGKEMRREERLVTWIPIIDETKNPAINPPRSEEQQQGQIQVEKGEEEQEEEATTTAPVDTSKLESQILGVLNQKEWKGPFQIAEELRDAYGGKYDFDLVETLCKKLAKNKLIEEDKVGEFFTRAKNQK